MSSTEQHHLALQRLAASRHQLRQQLLDLPNPADATAPAGSGFHVLPRRLRALWRSLRRQWRGSPMATIAMGATQNWWQTHPWRRNGELLAGELNHTVTPMLRRHPRAAIALAVGAGLALVVAKPWRWPLVAAQVRPLPRRVGRWMLSQLTQAPGQALLSALFLLIAGKVSATSDKQSSTAPMAADPAQPYS